MLRSKCITNARLDSPSLQTRKKVKNEISIDIPAKDAELDSLCICFVADMRLNNFTSNQSIDNYVEP